MALSLQADGGVYPIYSLTGKIKTDDITITYISTDTKPFVDKKFVKGTEIFKSAGSNVAGSGFNLIIRAYQATDSSSTAVKLNPKDFADE